eukprot:gene10159-21175_t
MEIYMNDDYNVMVNWRRSSLQMQDFMVDSHIQHDSLGHIIPPIPMIYSQLRPEGFNNQMVTVYFFMQASIQSGRALVLPLMIESNQWNNFDAMGPKGPFPFLDYFDHEHLMSFLPIVEHEDFVRWCSNRTSLLITNLRDGSEVSKKEALDAFNMHPQETITAGRLSMQAVGVDWNDVLFCSKDSDDGCMDRPQFDAVVLSSIRKDVDPKAVAIPHCIAVQRHLTSHVAFGKKAFVDFKKGYQGHSVYNERFRRVFKMIRPSKTVLCVAASIVREIGSAFNGIHVRRGDYRSFANDFSLGQRDRNKWKAREKRNVKDNGNANANTQGKDESELFGLEAIWQEDDALVKVVYTTLHLPLRPIFISSDEPEYVAKVLREANIEGLKTFVIKDFLHLFPLWMRGRNDLHLLVEQSLMVNASLFVGNRFSCVSSYVFKHRLLLNKQSITF